MQALEEEYHITNFTYRKGRKASIQPPRFLHSCIRTHYMPYFANFNGVLVFKEAFKLTKQCFLYVVVFALSLGR